MNEDDTFNVLKQTPHEQLQVKYRLWWWAYYDNNGDTTPSHEEVAEFLLTHGWTRAEFFKNIGR